jgi:gas vesicle protein
MKSLFARESSGVLMGLAWGAAGLVVGACAALLLTPKSGAELRRLIASLFGWRRARATSDEYDEARMEGEGGVAYEVTPPRARAH